MARRCGCAGTCQCVVQGSDCAVVSGDGSAASPYTVVPRVSAQPGNILECREVASGNPGLYAPVVGIDTVDGDCATLSGDGLPASPLRADVQVSADAGNQVVCRPNGLFVSASSVGAMDRATISMVNVQNIPASAGAGIPSTQTIEYDTIEEDTAGFTTISGGGSFEFTVPVGFAGYYLLAMQERDDAGALNLGTSVGIQIRLNGTVIASERFEREQATQKVLNCTRALPLVDGDILTGSFNITSTAGATAIHTIGPGGAGLPRFLQLTRLSV